MNDGENTMMIVDGSKKKALYSKDYNYIFDKTSGLFLRWGATKEEDPAFSPYGPEILDIEIDTGECLGNCPFCYKCNGSGAETKHMTIQQFREILSRMPRTLTQIAFGITNIYSNPDFWTIMEHARLSGIIPNYTTHGLDVDDYAVKMTKELCGAVAVSIVNKEKSYNAIKMFTDAGMDQVNIHFMLAEETYERAFSVVDDIKKDPRLAKMRAIVFLQYKPKGKGPEKFHSIREHEKYKKLINYCLDNKVNMGFDSCSAPLFLTSIADHPRKADFTQMAEPCEAFGMFSSYINVEGVYYPCSFCEGEGEWSDGLDVLHCDDFLKDVWFSDKVNRWRKTILESSQGCECEFKGVCRSCPVFDITSCKKLVTI